MEDLMSRFDAIDVLVNNAGIAADDLFLMMKPSKWDSVIDVALKGFYNVTKPVIKKMIRKKKAPSSPFHRFPGLWATGARSTTRRPKPG